MVQESSVLFANFPPKKCQYEAVFNNFILRLQECVTQYDQHSIYIILYTKPRGINFNIKQTALFIFFLLRVIKTANKVNHFASPCTRKNQNFKIHPVLS